MVADTVTADRQPADPRLVPRSALLGVLRDAGPGSVVLVCAQAGSGKTELLRSWAESEDMAGRVAWVSVERGEEDAQHFWLSVIAALNGAAGEAGLVEPVSATPEFRGEAVIERLLSDLHRLDERAGLVIDDLHELRSDPALRLLERLLSHMPPQLRVVLATRRDPEGLGLHRLRLTGQLTEIRGPELRFSADETRKLLQGTGIALPDDAVALLHERTEGWAAGLRLAALSLARHPDPVRFVTEFSGSERTVSGYLLAEVLERQPPEVRDLLLCTSVLDRVSGPLADVLTGRSGSERILQQLEDENAFVVSLDAARCWFRYHQLFADLLRLELRRTSPTRIGSLHRTAAEWYEQQHSTIEAIRHAQAGGDWPRAARLVADSYVSLVLDGRAATLHAALGAFPDDAPDSDPELALAFAACRLHVGALEESAAYAGVAQRLGDTVPASRRPRFDLQLAEVALALARRRGNLDAALEMMRSMHASLAAQPARELALGNDLRAAAMMDVGIVELWASRLTDARRDLEQALELARRLRRPYLEIACLAHLAMAAPLAGLPVAVARDLSAQALAIAHEHGWDDDPVTAAALAVDATVLLWLGRFPDCARRLEQARRAVRPDGEPGTELIIHQTTGLLAMTRHQFDAAFAAFDAAERMQALLAGEHALSQERRSRIAQAQAWIGDTDAAREMLAGMDRAAHDRAGIRLAEAAVLLAEGAPEQALEALTPVLERRETALKADWEALEASLLAALAYEQLGDRSAAAGSIERALDLAEPEGVLLPFVLYPVGDLLERQRGHRTTHAALLSEILDVRAGSAARPRDAVAPLREELSEAELRVVRYLPSNLKTPEIAAELFVSTNTVRTHLRHIYAKLDAHSRSDAVDRARELGLLAPTARV
ncbi:MAG TPA: LuxR C-terminal-related transcriptional regulator [Solirubrobacteraceae bacterium]|nr:LuxR C-terminal-related transcriptional regulator [Solirubrobacteraceae bacterium]